MPVRGATPPRVVISTDFDNEMDDYPAVAWALLSSVGSAPAVQIEAIYAEPFSFRWQTILKLMAYQIQETPAAERSAAEEAFLGGYATTLRDMARNGHSPQTLVETDDHAIWCPDRGMSESLASLRSFVALLRRAGGENAADVAALADTPVLAGSTEFITESDPAAPPSSDAVSDLIARGRAVTDAANDPLYVVSIGAPTNAAAALLRAPDLVEKIVVLWNGAWSTTVGDSPGTGSFNAGSDPAATRVLFESGVRLVYMPGFPVGMSLQLSRPESDAWFEGRGPLSDAIHARFVHNPDEIPYGIGDTNRAGTSRVQWDMGPLMPLISPGLVSSKAAAAVDLVQVDARCNGLLLPCQGTLRGAAEAGSGDFAAAPPVNVSCATLNLDGTSCRDGYFVPAAQMRGAGTPARRDHFEATMQSGVAAPSNVMRDLLVKLQAAQL